MKRFSDKQGFTLIEMIVVLVIMGIVAVVLVNVIVYSMQAYIFARNADQLSQKAQLAMARIKIELTDNTNVSTATSTQITYTVPKSAAPPSCTTAAGCQYTLLLSGTQVTLQDVTNSGTAQVLIDGLTAGNNGNNFLNYYQSDGTAWATTNGFSSLNKIVVNFYLNNDTGSGVVIPVSYEGSINPRANTILNAPSPN
jgi:prepilin-type N-terminal cleavage/methylation domain-containing protein